VVWRSFPLDGSPAPGGDMGEFPNIKIQSPMVAHLTPDQQDKVFAEIPQTHQRILWFMRIYPVRPEEACGLRWTDVLMDAEMPYFVIKNVATRQGGFKEHTKTNRVRPYPILPELKWIFEKNGKEFVLTRANGKPHSNLSLYATWKDANHKVSDVPKVSCYGAMKRSREWDLIDQVDSIEDVSLLMGHTSSKHTRRYAGQSLKRMAEILRGVHKPLLDGKSPKLLELNTKLGNLPSSPV
jgi:integrase